MASDFAISTVETRRKWSKVLEILKGNIHSLEIYTHKTTNQMRGLKFFKART